MDKRAKFIAELRREAKKRNLAFREEKDRGKGGHSMVWVGIDKVTTVPSREIDPKTARKHSASIRGLRASPRRMI
jgi:hypothetical protein